MHIALDASRVTIARRTGTENYALQLIRALLHLPESAELRFSLYFREPPAPGLLPERPNVRAYILPARRAWTHTRFAAALWRHQPDVTFVPAHTLPFLMRGRAVVTVHDLGYRFFPKAHRLRERLYLELTTRYSAWRAERVLADSQATRRDLIAQYGTSESKIRVVYPAAESMARASAAQIAAVRDTHNLPERYLLFLGTLQPRKNLTRLVQAFARYLQRSGDPDLSLVLAGQVGWLFEPERDLWAHLPNALRDRVRLLGYISEAEVAALYSGALAFVFPSLYEGFGIPALEALHCGTPVLCAESSSLPEVVGAAALMVNPLDVAHIAEGIERIVQDSALRAALIERGYAQAATFTWQRAAQQTLQALIEATR
ncbi:MAG: glycosyltransferase family 1 protein [Candidatus Thermofonsia Clade 1 bacterium]|uniref:Glycosyltransferase family 1 protein n=1 Tax=Candidatus Thermofonsia Clade 1 bacterium TaxID=2364210 RepID=A0A2M8PIB9_9CHLR|nr:MAG: glycosyltransferase family 1 protein [Candidatus Thermofonsia Clade 1 bacterium]RMF53817.1 MAG: glycosyltransferase family 1 protein [Chloroflexota bacterium]